MKHRIFVYQSTTYTYNVPEGVDPKEYWKKVDSGEIWPDERDSQSQGYDIYEVDDKGNPRRQIT